jgi:UDP-N-acetylglucosamine 2-epimerase (non-hydrolysing)
MKIVTILGTRPEIIRLSVVIRLLDKCCQHILVHTGQHYDNRLSQIFFDELEVRGPDVNLGVRAAGFGGQIGQVIERSEALLLEHRPDRLLILGDTNSGLAALVARRLGIPVYHMEAGSRCYDDRVPEEINRRVIDHLSSVLMPYTNRGRENLLAEGFPSDRVYVIGNPIKQVIENHRAQIARSRALEELGVEPQRYFLATLHRAENVDVPDRLRNLVNALALLHLEFGYPVLCSLHPRTRSKAAAFGIDLRRAGLSVLEPLGFFDFVSLEQAALCLLSDSGTVQEEGCVLGVPHVTMRDATERIETLECGANILSGTEPSAVLSAVRLVTSEQRRWQAPDEYLVPAVAETVCRILLGFRSPDTAEVGWQRRNWRSAVAMREAT